ncbi:MAG: hypothetical protein IKV46_07160 [Bacteroidales bacterium]|jgi:hypothetical protein|nr:hypothetical protein [Bacteroidales bacterium]
MKSKLVKLLAIFMAIFTFSSCEEVDELTGDIDITIGKETFHIPAATFYSNDSFTIITGTNLKQSVAIKVKDAAVGKKTLGLGKTALSAVGNLGDIASVDNTLVYVPSSGIEKDGMTALYGTITITKKTAASIEGTFEGGGIKTSIIDEMQDVSITELDELITEFSGEFSAIGLTTK